MPGLVATRALAPLARLTGLARLAGGLAALTTHHVITTGVAARRAARGAARRAPGLAGRLARLAGSLARAALAAHHRLVGVSRVRRRRSSRIRGRHAQVLQEAAHHVHVHAHVVAASVATRVATRVTTSLGHFLYTGMRK